MFLKKEAQSTRDGQAFDRSKDIACATQEGMRREGHRGRRTEDLVVGR